MKTESFLFALNYSIQLIHKQPAALVHMIVSTQDIENL